MASSDYLCIRANKSKKRKQRPANEVSEQDINNVLKSIQNCNGYPKLRDLASMVPFLAPLQLNAVIRFLERSGTIIIDSDGYIIWTRKDNSESLSTLQEVAYISSDFKEYLEKHWEWQMHCTCATIAAFENFLS